MTSNFKQKFLTFGIAAASLLSSCEKTEGENKIVHEEKIPEQNDAATPQIDSCIVEVPCNEPELDVLYFNLWKGTGLTEVRKYYDFCDSTVTIVGTSTGDRFGAIYNVRSITELKGTERKEKDQAYLKLKAAQIKPQ